MVACISDVNECWQEILPIGCGVDEWSQQFIDGFVENFTDPSTVSEVFVWLTFISSRDDN